MVKVREKKSAPSKGDKPKTPEVIKEMTVETFGVEYPAPKTV